MRTRVQVSLLWTDTWAWQSCCKCESTAALATCTWPLQYHSVDILAVMIVGLLRYLYEQKSCWLFMAAKGGGGYHISLGMWLLIGTSVPVEWTTYLGIIFEQTWSREWAVFKEPKQICREQMEENVIQYLFVYVKISKNKLSILLIIRDVFNKSSHLIWGIKGWVLCHFLGEFIS